MVTQGGSRGSPTVKIQVDFLWAFGESLLAAKNGVYLRLSLVDERVGNFLLRRVLLFYVELVGDLPANVSIRHHTSA